MNAAAKNDGVYDPAENLLRRTAGLRPFNHGAAVPLVVDIDGSLIRSDLLIESAFRVVGDNPLSVFGAMRAMLRGKAALKTFFARDMDLVAETLPYDPAVLSHIETARGAGQPVYIASASNARLVAAVARHVGADGWFASDDDVNLSGRVKRQALVDAFGERGFDYIGNAAPDLHIWEVSRRAIVAGGDRALHRKAGKSGDALLLEHRKPGPRVYLKALRVHQYVKNVLIFVPVVTAHVTNAHTVGAALLAFVSFCLCASSVYLLNDLVDLDADRAHPTKCRRPFACGAIPLWQGLVGIPLLLAAAIGIAAIVSWATLAMLLFYLAVTTAYSFYIKKKMIIDAVTLAMLYTIRVIMGGVATELPISEWLLAFSLFVFLSLALVKRYTEIATRIDAALPDPTNRNYKAGDLHVVMSVAAASAMNAVTVFSFYITSGTVKALYRQPQALWLFCPLLAYWLARMLMLASRRVMTEDPIVFAVRDRISLLAGVTAAAILAAAMLL